MLLESLLEQSKFLLESQENLLCEKSTIAWGRSGNKLVRKYRCPFGRRKGRLVTNLGKCSAPVDLKKRIQLKRTKAAFGSRMSRKARRTKRFNPASKRVQALNRMMR